jgi:PKD repeat protein
MKKHILSIFVFFIGFATLQSQTKSCDFTYSAAGLTVNFTDITVWSPCSPTPSWNFGDPASGGNNTSIISNPTHTFSAAGTYTVCLSFGSSASICSTTFATKCTTITVPASTSGIKTFDSDLKAFSVSPNPADEEFSISYSLRSDASVKLDVYNLLGEKVAGIVNDSQPKGNYTYSSKEIAHLSKGIYFVKLSLNDSSRTIKVIVQ